MSALWADIVRTVIARRLGWDVADRLPEKCFNKELGYGGTFDLAMKEGSVIADNLKKLARGC